MTRRSALLACTVLLLATACAPPISVRRVGVRRAQQQVNQTVLSGGQLSRRTNNLLYDQDLVERYAKDPAGALAALHAAFVAGQLRPESTVSLAEVSFHHALHGGGSPYFLAAALYAWDYLFPPDSADAPDGFNPRTRVACELYNRGLTEGLRRGDSVELRPASWPLPFGTLDVRVEPEALEWSGHRLKDFVPVNDLEVKGFATYYRWPGIGAPLAAGVVPTEDGDRDILARRIRVPVTAVLRPVDLSRQLREGRVAAGLELYPGYGEATIDVGDRHVPLEAEPTATMALSLSETAVWKREYAGFLRGMGVVEERARLVSTRPYRPGLIPVVFVHGTGSSAIRWADLYNELDNDPRIHRRFQFWFFSYETGNPILYSAMRLRESLTHAVQQLDPEGRDPALRRMVVIGHSQGGLLGKTTVVESGDAFWRNASRVPFADAPLSEQTRDLLSRALFVHPLPFVRRVVFVSTPHRGSYVAGSWFAQQAARLIRAPLDVTRIVTEAATLNRQGLAIEGLRGTPTAVDNMTPGNRFVKTLLTLPITPGVAAHSIISVKGAGPPQGRNDGVVEYDSAHIEGVESELVVDSPHSCQSNPHTIAEVRRLLLLHLQEPP